MISMLQWIVNIIAILTGAYTLYGIIQKPKISLYTGDAVRIIVYPDGRTSAFHLMCNLVNKTQKVGTVHRLEVRVLGPQGSRFNLIWSSFYKYLPGGQEVQKESDPYPVAILGKDSKLLFVEFQAEMNQNLKWVEGKHQFEVIGWVNCKDRREPSNLKSEKFNVQITKDILLQLNKPNSTRPIYITVPIMEWEQEHK